MRAMIFAAGLGTRLKPLTDDRPKAMVEIEGKPLLFHIISRLKSFGYDEFVINIHHFPDMIINYLSEHNNFGVEIKISDERDFLRETGGGLEFAERFLKDSPQSRFLVHNVDILTNFDLALLNTSSLKKSIATLVVSDRKTSRYLIFDKTDRLLGWTNMDTGEIRSPYADINLKENKLLAFSGIHNISTEIFPLFRKFGFRDKFSIIDFYLRICKDFPIYGVVQPSAKIIDVGKLNSLELAKDFLAESSLK